MSDSESDSDIKNKMNESDMEEEYSDDQKLKEKQSTENSTKNQTKENSLNVPKKEEKKIKEESSDSDDSSEENKKKEKEKEKEKEKIKEDKKEDLKEDIKEEKQKKRKKSDSSDSSDSSSDSDNKEKNIKKSNQTKEKVSEKNENDENAKKQKEIEENERKERDKKKKEDEERKKKEEEDRRKKEEEKRKKEEEDKREKNNNANFRFQREDKKFEEKYEYSSRSNYNNNNFRRSENYNQNNNYENRYNQQESTYTKKKAKKYDYNTEKILNNIITDNIEIIDEMMNAYPGIMKLDCANILKKIKKNTSSYTLFEIMNNVHRDISIDITLNKENEENQNNLSQIDPYEVIDNFYNNPDHVKMMKYYKVFSLEDKEKLPPYLQESLPKYFYYNKNKEKEERRRKLIKYSDGSFNYIPVNCQKNCENNKNCIYAHNDNENEYHPLFYKTILSNNLGHGNDKRLVKGATNLFEDFRIIYNYKNESIIKLMNLFSEKKFSKFSFKEYLKNKIESFSLNTFKTLECPSVKSGLNCLKEDSHLCYYYHDIQERRRPPTLYRYTNEICKNKIKKGKIIGKCKNGEFCNKCHSKYELYYHILFYGKAMTCIRPRKLGKCIFEETCYAYHPYMEPGYKKTKEEIIKEEKDRRLEKYTDENKKLNILIEKFRCSECKSFKKRLNYCLLLTCNHIICSKCFKTSKKCPKCGKKIKKDKEGEDFIQIDITASSNNIDELMKKNYDKKKEEETKAENDTEKNINKEEEKEKSKKKNESESDDEEEEKEDNNKDSENDNDCNKSM